MPKSESRVSGKSRNRPNEMQFPAFRAENTNGSQSAGNARSLRPNALDDLRRRISFSEGDADHLAATRFDDMAPDDRVLAPVGAFDEDVRLDGADDFVRRLFVEDHRRINRR